MHEIPAVFPGRSAFTSARPPARPLCKGCVFSFCGCNYYEERGNWERICDISLSFGCIRVGLEGGRGSEEEERGRERETKMRERERERVMMISMNIVDSRDGGD